MDVCSGCNGLLMVGGEDELLLNELNELDRSTGVELNREEEKLGMPHWQHIQDVLSVADRGVSGPAILWGPSSAIVRPNVCQLGALEASRWGPRQSPGDKHILATI